MTLSPAILGITTAVPTARYPQADILGHFLELQGPNNRRSRAIRAIFERAGVGYRHMIAREGYFATRRTTQERNDLYMAEAVPLGEQAIRASLAQHGYQPEDIDDFFVVSCTGFNIPGLDLHLAGRLGMRPDLNRTCILGMGCYGAFPALRRARETVSHSERLALVLTLELCSLHMQSDNTAENIVSSALFSDGAAVVLVGNQTASRAQNPGPKIVDMATHCDYQTLDHMAFTVTDQGFRMYLSSYVPDLLAANVATFVDRLLAHNQLQRQDIRFWGIHPGSTKIVDYVQSRLGLNDEQVKTSHQILYNYGNMSSATILFVLEQIQRCEQPQPGDYGVLLAFGPGLTMESLLVRW
ncbi:MAG TPA: type III polyketide synthase [Phototrophicaceae bacterium]|nr:type III polyketide synthase [Phototrophicaceae bacterium]